MAKNKLQKSSSNLNVTRITRTLYFFVGIFALTIVIFDSGNLLTREAVIDRWALITGLLLANTFVWYYVSRKPKKPSRHFLIIMLTQLLLIFAGYMTYWERGMASTSTILYVLPLLVIATLKNRHELLATAVAAAGIYSFAAVKYFNDFFNEGFRIQLWGNITLIVGTIFTAAWLIMIITGLRKDSK